MQASTVPCDKAGSQLACVWSINYCSQCTRDGLLHAVLAVAKEDDIVTVVSILVRRELCFTRGYAFLYRLGV